MGYFYNDPELDEELATATTSDDYIEDFAVFVCPSSERYRNPTDLKDKWKWKGPSSSPENTFSAYIYRAESGYPAGKETLMLSDAKPAIVMDYNYYDTATPADSKYNHKGEYVNILFRNGNVKGVENKDSTGATNKDGLLTLGASGQTEDDIFEDGADSYQ